MINFQQKYNLLITIFIIALIGSLWFFIQLSPSTKPQPLVQKKVVERTYREKIDNFTLRQFDENQQLSHLIKADNYFSFNKSDALLLNPTLTIYNKKGEANYVLSAKKADYLADGKLKFYAEVLSRYEEYGKQPIIIQANTVIIDKEKQRSTYSGGDGGDVKIKSGDLSLVGQTVILLRADKKLSKIMVQGTTKKQAYYQQQSKQKNLIKAMADDIGYDINKQFIRLKGNAEVTKDGEFFTAETLDYDISKNKLIFAKSAKGKDKVQFKIKP